jgi:hypothetical protein
LNGMDSVKTRVGQIRLKSGCIEIRIFGQLW